jgi:hypothetical protein
LAHSLGPVRSDAPIISRRATAQRVAPTSHRMPSGRNCPASSSSTSRWALGLLMFDRRQHYRTEGGLRRRVDLARHQSG